MGNKETPKQITNKQLVKNKRDAAEGKTGNKLVQDSNSFSSTKNINDIHKDELIIPEGRSDKKVAIAETEIQNRNLKIVPPNTSLQNLLTPLSGNNKISIQEKPIAAIKNAKPKISKKSLFSATVFYSPDFVSSRVDNDRHHFREEDRNEIKNKEEIKNSSSTGLLINYNTIRKLSIQSGLTFSSMVTDIKPKLIYARPDDRGIVNYRFNCSAGYSYVPLHSGSRPTEGDSIFASSSKNILHYIEFPLTLKYNIRKGKFTLNPGLGLVANFLTKGRIETVIVNKKTSISHIEGLNSMYLNSAISLSMNYDINQNVSIGLTPAARFALTSINKDAPIKTYLNLYGLAAGLTIKL